MWLRGRHSLHVRKPTGPRSNLRRKTTMKKRISLIGTASVVAMLLSGLRRTTV